MKKIRSTKRFENFLRTSSQPTLQLNEDQVGLLSFGLSFTEVISAVDRAGWTVTRAELLQNGLITFSLRDIRQVCSCGKRVKHYHFNESCCGTEECCPEYPIETDPDIEIASIISRMREP